MHDVYNNLTPLNFLRLCTSLHEVHKYNTRSSSNNNLHVKQSRLNKQINNFQKLELGYSKNIFKKTLHDILFSILIEEEDYVDLPKMRKLQNTKIK